MTEHRDAQLLSVLSRLLAQSPLSRATARQIAVLLACYSQHEPQSVRALARRLRISRHLASVAVRRLESWALLKRSVDPMDQRGIVAEQTPTGRDLLRSNGPVG
jgi:DNA-binding MarR family transcriptional regulator